MAAAKKAPRKTPKRATRSRKPAAARGPEPKESILEPTGKDVAALVEQVGKQGGVGDGPSGARREAGLPDPRTQHRKSAQPSRPQPRGDPHGPPARQRATSLEGDGARRHLRLAGLPDAGRRLRAALPLRRLLLPVGPQQGRPLPR